MQSYLFSMGSAIVSIVSLFLSGLTGIVAALAGVVLAFIASRKDERGYLVGMFIGAGVMIFLNLQTFGLFPSGPKLEVLKVYESIRQTNAVYAMISDGTKKYNGKEIETAIHNGLSVAEQVEAAILEPMVPGFSDSFSGEYIKGFTIIAEGYGEGDSGKKIAGALLIDNWGRWNVANRENLEKARKKTPSLASYFLSLL